MSKTWLSIFILAMFLTATFKWDSVQAGYATLFGVRVSIPSSAKSGQEIVVQTSIIVSGCSSCQVSNVKAALALPSQANLTHGDNPANVGSMRGGESKNVSWTIVFQEPGSYSIEVNASGLDSDLVPCSVFGSAMVGVVANPGLLGDLNGDDVVSIADLYIVARAFGCSPGNPNWNPVADLDDNGFVNIFDLFSVAKEFGKTN